MLNPSYGMMLLATPPPPLRVRHWTSRARKACGLTGFEHRDVLLPRRGPHVRTAIGGNQDRRGMSPNRRANVPDDGDPLPRSMVIVDQKTGGPVARALIAAMLASGSVNR